MLPLLLPIGGGALALTVLISYLLSGSETTLPTHLLSTSQGINPQTYICNTYAALIAHHPPYHTSPPSIYSLFDVPSTPTSPLWDIQLMMGLQAKTAALESRKKGHAPGSDVYNEVQREIDMWYRAWVVVGDPKVRAVYDRVVMKVAEKEGMKRALLGEGMCGEIWKE